jgi:hypothetical protein
MEGNLPQTREHEFAEPTPAEVRTEENRKDHEAVYWGVLCKTCRGIVAFDVAPYVSFGPVAASMQPGAICCGKRHNHIYYPRDFGFRGSTVPIAEAVMQGNRDLYKAVNSPGHCTSHDSVAPKAVEPVIEPKPGESAGELESGKARSAKIGPDPRREAARLAAKGRWADWAVRKRA